MSKTSKNQQKKSILNEISEKMKQKMMNTGSIPQISPSKRLTNLENKLGLKAVSKSDRFEEVLKEFKGLDTFFTINELLQELSSVGMSNERSEIEREKIKILLEQEKLKRWKTQFPQHLEFDSTNRYTIKSELLQRARKLYNLERYEPKLKETVHNLKPYLKDKFRTIDLREHPQLQLFKDITDIRQMEIEKKKIIIPMRMNTNMDLTQLQTPKPQIYYDQFQEEADKLRIRLREQQLEFFNKKWGNSVVKMKVKEQQFKRQAQRQFKVAAQLGIAQSNQEIRKKIARESIMDPQMKDIISDVCYEEADMMEEKKEIKSILRQMQDTHNKFFHKYEEPEVMGLRMITK